MSEETEIKKVGGIVVSHGKLASELLAAAKMVVGEMDHITAVSIGWNDDVESAKDEIANAIKKVSRGNGVLIMTDMFGGTPTNISAMFLKVDEVEIVTGVNLPMVVKLSAQNKPLTLRQMTAEVEQQGKTAIYCASGLLAPAKK
jgi:PTS system mannose-specific IIA component